MRFYNISKLIEMVRANDGVMHKIQEYVKFEYLHVYRWDANDTTPEEKKEMNEKNAAKERVAFEIYQDIMHILGGDLKFGPRYDIDVKMLINISVELMYLLLRPTHPRYPWAKKYKRFMVIWTGEQYMINDLNKIECTRVKSLLDDPAHYLLYPSYNKLEIEATVKNVQELMDSRCISAPIAVSYYGALEDIMTCNPIFRFDRVDRLIRFIAYDEGEIQHDNV